MKKILFVGLLIAAIAGISPLAAEVNSCQHQNDGDLCSSILGEGRCKKWEQYIICDVGKQFYCDEKYINRDCKCQDGLDGKCVQNGTQYKCDCQLAFDRQYCKQLPCNKRINDMPCFKFTDLIGECDLLDRQYCGQLPCDKIKNEKRCQRFSDLMGMCQVSSADAKICYGLLEKFNCNELRARGCDEFSDIATNGGYQTVCISCQGRSAGDKCEYTVLGFTVKGKCDQNGACDWSRK